MTDLRIVSLRALTSVALYIVMNYSVEMLLIIVKLFLDDVIHSFGRLAVIVEHTHNR